MFPVKRVGATAATCLGIALICTSCGYRSLNAAHDTPESRLSVAPAALAAPEGFALEAAVAGARRELGRAGALKSSGYPRLVVELVRVDETSSGIAALDDRPLARGSVVAVVVRGWVERSAGAERERDTGNVRRVERFSTATPSADSQRHLEAARAAARAAGGAIARRVLGEPEPLGGER
jgi:hypothetical protein